MATSGNEKVLSVDALSREERMLVVSALLFYRTSKARAMKAASDDKAMAELHSARIKEIDALSMKFS